ncbi:hypothetical protein N9K06_00070 [Omnitrophica bacterium]|nr:hypothetical protein [Candidatus Omnitrophota bacterium]
MSDDELHLIDPSIVGKWIKAEPIHCHQRLEKNQLIEKVRACSEDGKSLEVKFRFNPDELEFFFDHAIDHLPGMLEVNGMRQLSLALAHLIYRIPMNYIALLGWLKVQFYSYGALRKDTFANVRLMDHDALTQFRKVFVFRGIMHQGETKLMRMDGELIMMHPVLAEKVRLMKISTGDFDRGSVSSAFSW